MSQVRTFPAQSLLEWVQTNLPQVCLAMPDLDNAGNNSAERVATTYLHLVCKCLDLEDWQLDPTIMYGAGGQRAAHAAFSADPELFSPGVGRNVLVAAVRSLFSRISPAEEFYITDIIKPEAKRTLRFMSILIEFLCVKEERSKNFVRPLFAQKESTASECDALRADIGRVEAEIERFGAQQADKEAHIEAMSKEAEAGERELKQLAEHAASLEKSGESALRRRVAVDADMAALTSKLESLRADLVSLDRELVASPARLQSEAAGMESAAEGKCDQIARQERLVAEHMAKADGLRAAQRQLGGVTDELGKARAALDSADENRRRVQEATKRVEERCRDIELLRHELAGQRAAVARSDESFNKKLAAVGAQVDECRREQRRLRGEIERAEGEREHEAAFRAEMLERGDAIRSELAAQRDEHRATVDKVDKAASRELHRVQSSSAQMAELAEAVAQVAGRSADSLRDADALSEETTAALTGLLLADGV